MSDYVHNKSRDTAIQRSRANTGLPLFDQRPMNQKKISEAALPAMRKSIRSLTDVQRAALNSIAGKMGTQNFHALMLFASGETLCSHDVSERACLSVNVTARVLNTLRCKLSLIEFAFSAPGPYGASVAFYRINQSGLQKIADTQIQQTKSIGG